MDKLTKLPLHALATKDPQREQPPTAARMAPSNSAPPASGRGFMDSIRRGGGLAAEAAKCGSRPTSAPASRPTSAPAARPAPAPRARPASAPAKRSSLLLHQQLTVAASAKAASPSRKPPVPRSPVRAGVSSSVSPVKTPSGRRADAVGGPRSAWSPAVTCGGDLSSADWSLPLRDDTASPTITVVKVSRPRWHSATHAGKRRLVHKSVLCPGEVSSIIHDVQRAGRAWRPRTRTAPAQVPAETPDALDKSEGDSPEKAGGVSPRSHAVLPKDSH
eukprot:gnl/TRDRNA2_/TRDRNA2_44040_c0_seq1.p1 gnl/TRDRNA2_/TRDRNA2_44040_c0~~gnl/TRDRNA2_/TRDRNA2_44040_c0_seq1.p1  ORF type:complete len:275 (-),score=27.62 gnl/TRDRNA2_/TRDRNA2_44040_c0_seq1:10-834(-)